MKIRPSYKPWGFAGIVVLAVALTLIAWTGNPPKHEPATQNTQDTVPSKKRNKVTREPGNRDFDKELRALEKAETEISARDWEEVQREIDQAMKNIDMEKIQLQVEDAMKQVDVDMEKIQKEIEESIEKIDFEKIRKEVELSMDGLAKVDMEKVNADLKRAEKEVQQALANKDWEKELKAVKEINVKEIRKEIEKEMEKVKEEMARVKDNLKGEELNFKDEMKKAGAEIEKARDELKGFQEMVYAMEKEGLLSTAEDYTIEYAKGELTINGKKQGQEVTNRYKKYFKHDKTTITKEDGDINIHHNSNSNINKN